MPTHPHPSAADKRPPQFARLKKLRESSAEPADETLAKARTLLESIPTPGSVQLKIIDSSGHATVHKLTPAAAEPTQTPRGKSAPRVELIMSPDTWSTLAMAELSPLEAFLQGKLRVRGDSVFAQDLLGHLAGSKGMTRLCGEAKK